MIEIFTDKAGKYRWHRIISSDITADSGQGYADKGEAWRMASQIADEGEEIKEVETPSIGEHRASAPDEEVRSDPEGTADAITDDPR